MTLVWFAVIFGPIGLAATFALCLCVIATRSDRAVAREYQRRHAHHLDVQLLGEAERNLTVKGRTVKHGAS